MLTSLTLLTTTTTLLATAFASSLEDLSKRAVGDECNSPTGLGTGTCKNTLDCKGVSHAGSYCPNDPGDVLCCVEISCVVNEVIGYCRNQYTNGCPEGSFDSSAAAACPGGPDIQCCLTTGSYARPPPPPLTFNTLGAEILAQAETAAGLPYAWGGGSCGGATADEPMPGASSPRWHVGFDCSGLVSWAICTVTGRDLFQEGLRNTAAMYCAEESKLGYQKYPYSQRQPGDAVFFGGACDCTNWATIYHVGLMIDSGDRLWAAPNYDLNRVMETSILAVGDKPCQDVIRFS